MPISNWHVQNPVHKVNGIFIQATTQTIAQTTAPNPPNGNIGGNGGVGGVPTVVDPSTSSVTTTTTTSTTTASPSLDLAFEYVDAVSLWHVDHPSNFVVVVDPLGGTDAASFCALSTLQEQIRAEQTVDIYQVRMNSWMSERLDE